MIAVKAFTTQVRADTKPHRQRFAKLIGSDAKRFRTISLVGL
jgi:hypothetical protein